MTYMTYDERIGWFLVQLSTKTDPADRIAIPQPDGDERHD